MQQALTQKKSRSYRVLKAFTWSASAWTVLFPLLFFAFTSCANQQESEPLTLIRDGRPAATIVIPDAPLAASDQTGRGSLSQKTAAETLRYFIAQASGAELPIVKASDAPADGTLILVGQSTVSERYDLAPPTDFEGFRIISFPRGVAILGEIAKADDIENNTEVDLDRGVVHGVHDFLARFLGCKFYFDTPDDPDLGVTTPERTTITLTTPIDVSDAPAFKQRQLIHASMAAHRPGNADGRVAGHSQYGPAWKRQYKDSHPEFFLKLPDGRRAEHHLCYSEPGMLETEIKHIADWIEKGVRSPVHNGKTLSKKYIIIGPDDLFPAGGCACEACQSKKQKGYDGAWSELYWDYVSRFAQEIARRWPEKKVVAMPYTTWLEPPSFDLPDNVHCQLCIHPGGAQTYGHLFLNYQPEMFDRHLALVKRWSEKLGGDPDKLSLRMYGTNTHTGIPVLYAKSLQRWLKAIQPHCRGVYFDGVYGRGNTPRDYLMTWLWFQLLWNPDLDVDQAIDAHCRAFFGPAAAPMASFYHLVGESYEKPWDWKQLLRMSGLGFSLEMLYTQKFTPSILDRLDDDLRQACRAAGLPGDPAWTVPPDSAWVLRNPDGKKRTYPVSLAAVDGTVNQPTLIWPEGRLTYRGALAPGQRLVVNPDEGAILFAADGTRENVTQQVDGGAPVLDSGAAMVVYYDSVNASPLDRTRVTFGDAVGVNPESFTDTLHKRRVHWVRRQFDVHTLGRFGRYTSPNGPQALGRMAQWWIKRGEPTYDVPWTQSVPSPEPGAEGWETSPPIPLVRSSVRAPNNADLNVGFPAAAPTTVKLLRDNDNLYVLFQCFQPLPPGEADDAVVVRFCEGKKGLFELAVRPDGACFKPPLVGWSDINWRKHGFPSDPEGVQIQTDRHYPAFKTVKVPPAAAACVLADGSEAIDAWKYGLRGGHMPHKGGLRPFVSYLRFDVPPLKAGEQLASATFHGYLRSYLSANAPCGAQISHVTHDQWKAESAKPDDMPMEDTIRLQEVGPRNERKGGWFTTDIGRYLRKAEEGPGHPLTVAVSATGYQGARGFAFSMDEKARTHPYLELQIAENAPDSPSWWSVLLTIPKDKLDGAFPKQVKADFGRIHGDRYYQATPWLVYVWSPSPTPARMHLLKFSETPAAPLVQDKTGNEEDKVLNRSDK